MTSSEHLKRRLAKAIRRGDADEQRAVKAELDRIAGRNARKETR